MHPFWITMLSHSCLEHLIVLEWSVAVQFPRENQEICSRSLCRAVSTSVSSDSCKQIFFKSCVSEQFKL